LAVVARLLSTLVLRRWRGWTLPLQHVLARNQKKNPHTPPQPYQQDNISNLQAAVARSLMTSLAENLQARRQRVAAYQQLLGNEAAVELIAHQPGSACLTQVLRVLPERRADDGAARVVAVLAEAGYEVQGSYLPIHQLDAFSACVWDRLPHTEKVWPDLVELPCEPGVSLAEVEKIATIVKNCLAN
jgi:dTDP-4-amino-4,6-dideoxygalactose transaminase